VRIDTRPRKRNAPRPAEKSAPGFLQWLRGRECLVGNADCRGKSQAAHVDYAGDKGIGTKVSDRFAVPMCAHHHGMQHNMGWPRFETWFFRSLKSLGGEGYALRAAEQFWAKWPGRIAWERKQEAQDG
jgi:hypothetical protein